MGRWVSYLNRERKLDSLVGRCPTAPPAPKGLYLYGNVGSGVLLDLIFCLSFKLLIIHPSVAVSWFPIHLHPTISWNFYHFLGNLGHSCGVSLLLNFFVGILGFVYS